jgi:tyrosyl-tRNA synthetase
MEKIITSAEKITEVLEKGVEKIYPNPEALEELLKSGKRIRLYCGYDPTATSLHIGHAITLRKLAQFQRLGHEVIFLIGDFTAMIGDPSDKTAARKKLSRKEILLNLKNYKKQASKILNFSGKNPAKVLYNGDWNNKLKFGDLIEMASNFTVQQMIIRDMFQERIKNNKPIYLHEFFYPLAQAYDCVAMDVDLEIGGNDQTFNMLCGRDLIKALKSKEKLVLTLKLLTDSAGKKMGKTEGNMINLDENPDQMYGKIMSWPDELIIPGLELCTDFSIKDTELISENIKSGKTNPRNEKAKLAKEIVTVHYDKKTAEKAEKEFNLIFKEGNQPTDIPEINISDKKILICDLLLKTKLAPSKSEAKRLIEQKAIDIDGTVLNDWKKEITPKSGMIIRAGKRKFAKLA